MKNNKHDRPRKPSGRPEEPLETRVEFIRSEEANERWRKIFELLEAARTSKHNKNKPNNTDGSVHDQLSLF